MHRIDTVTAQKDKFGAGKNGFTRGNPQTGTPATDLDDDYFDMLQEELCAVVEESGEELDKEKHNQLLTALRALLLSRSNPFGDIASDGPAAIATALSNLGLGAGSPAVGIPFFWPHTQMPNNLVDDWNQMTFLKMNGSSFTAAEYPVLAKIWPGLVLPDFRGEFIRIWDDGRGIDSGRNLLTAQSFAMQNITGSFGEIADESKQYAVEINTAYGAFQVQTYMRNIMRNPNFAVRNAAASITFDASRVVQTAAETRPRNISIGFIVRAK